MHLHAVIMLLLSCHFAQQNKPKSFGLFSYDRLSLLLHHPSLALFACLSSWPGLYKILNWKFASGIVNWHWYFPDYSGKTSSKTRTASVFFRDISYQYLRVILYVQVFLLSGQGHLQRRVDIFCYWCSTACCAVKCNHICAVEVHTVPSV